MSPNEEDRPAAPRSRPRPWFDAALMAAVLVASCSAPGSRNEARPSAAAAGRPAPASASLRFEAESGEVVAAGLDHAAPATAEPASDADRLQVYVGRRSTQELAKGTVRPVGGRLAREGGALRFTPRYPWKAGLEYTAILRDASPTSASEPQLLHFALPAPPPPEDAVVLAVHPSPSRLPSNLLKFYLHFSQPMARGEAYHRVRLRDTSEAPDEGGGEHSPRETPFLEIPFLEIDEELWNPDGTRLTLFLDPARVKRGLVPHEQQGPVLQAARRYSLVVDEGWPTAEGGRLKGHRKDFETSDRDERCPAPQQWQLQLPSPGGRAPLHVRLDEALDHALLSRMIRVRSPTGELSPGQVEIGDDERSWSFVPDTPWIEGSHRLRVDTRLEDLAGNSVERPFEVDRFERVDDGDMVEFVELEFELR